MSEKSETGEGRGGFLREGGREGESGRGGFLSLFRAIDCGEGGGVDMLCFLGNFFFFDKNLEMISGFPHEEEEDYM